MRTVLFKYSFLGMTRCCQITTGQLMDAIAVVESNRGATSANVYQLREIYVEDVNRITGQCIRFDQAVGDDALARLCIDAYWKHYVHRYENLTGRMADAEVLARIHNGGPDGWRKSATKAYWRNVSAELILNGLKAKGGR